MIVKADLKCKQTDFNLPKCSIEKTVRLTASEFSEFVSNPLGYYDFLREFNAEKHEYRADSIPCLLLTGEGHTDGFVINTQGYDYARYTAAFKIAVPTVQTSAVLTIMQKLICAAVIQTVRSGCRMI